MKLAGPASPAAGDELVFIGNPEEGGPFSRRTGKIVEVDEQLQQSIDKDHCFITTDADIISGYSGGPVFDLEGKLVGLSNAAFTGDLSPYGLEHLSLVIPIRRVKEKIDKAIHQ